MDSSSSSDFTMNLSNDTNSKLPTFPNDGESFVNYKLKMESCLSARELLSCILSPSPYIPYKIKQSDAKYLEWVTLCETAFEKAEKALREAKDGKDRSRIYENNNDVQFRENVRKNRKASELILNTLKDKQMNVVSRVFVDNAYELWRTIVTSYGVVKTNDTINSLLNYIQHIKKDVNEHMRDYVARVSKVVNQLSELGEIVSASRHKHILRQGLTHLPSYNTQLAIFEKLDSDKVSVDSFETKLIAEDNKQRLQKSIENNSSNSTALATTSTAAPQINNNKITRFRFSGRGRGRGSKFRGGRHRFSNGFRRFGKPRFNKHKSDSASKDNEKDNNGSDNEKDNASDAHNDNENDKESSRGRPSYRGRDKHRHGYDNRYGRGFRNYRRSYYDRYDNGCYRCGHSGHKAYECTTAAYSTSSQHQATSKPQQPQNIDFVLSTICDDYYNNTFNTATVWILDSAATKHHTGNKSLLHNIRTLETPGQTKTGNGICKYYEIGDANINVNGTTITITDVVYIPGFTVNLISEHMLTQKGCIIMRDDAVTEVRKKETKELIFTAKQQHGLYTINTQHAYANISTNTSTSTTHTHNDSDRNVLNDIKLLHEKYGHVSYSRLHSIIKRKCVNGISNKIIDNKQLNKIMTQLTKHECVGCVKGKMHRLPMTGVIDWNTKAPMDLFVMDVMGPMKTQSIGGHKYVLLLMDVHTRMLFIFVLKKKSDSVNIIINKIKQCQTHTGLKLKHIHSDGARDLLLNNEMKEFLTSNGTRASVTTAGTPQHNGIIERTGRTSLEMVKSMMHHCNAYRALWGAAFLMVAYIWCRCITSADPSITPHEGWYKIKPSIGYLHVFGCDVYYHIHKSKRDEKLDANAKKGIFVGYDENNDTYYVIFDTETFQIVVSRDVQFYENSFEEMKKLNEYQQQTDVQKIINEHAYDSDWLPDEYFSSTESISTLFSPIIRSEINNTTDSDNDESKINTRVNNMNVNTVPVISSSSSNDRNVNTINNNNENDTSIVVENEYENEVNSERSVHVTLRGSNEERSERSNDASNDVSNEVSNDVTHNVNNERNNVPTRKRSQRNMNTANNKINDEYVDVHAVNIIQNSDAENSRVTRERKVRRLDDYDYSNVTVTINTQLNSTNNNEPTTYDEAINCDEASKWKKAIDEELQSHNKNKTWSIANIKDTASINIIDTKWIFKVKTNADGKIVRYKARLVARGFTQEYGIDYTETFAPVLKTKSLRLILALSATEEREIVQFDVKTAFLNAQVHEDIYIAIPQGMKVDNKDGNTVLKLNKALYGIKQAPREWNININNYLLTVGFLPCKKDPCIYVKISKHNNSMILGLFVDDIIVSYTREDKQEWSSIKQALMTKYEISDMGRVSSILGIMVNMGKRNDIYIHQQKYIKEKLQLFNMHTCKSCNVPGDVNIMLDDNTESVDSSLYRSMVGALMYMCLYTRPDITHAVNICSRFMSNPTVTHMQAIKKVFRYLAGNSEYGIRYNNNYNNNKVTITGYSDADWGGDKYDRKSTTGYCVFVNNNLITWNTKKQETVALSSAEAELMAIVEVTKEVTWMNNILEEMHYDVHKPISVMSDNQSAIKIAQNDIEHDRTKHIAIKYYYIRDEINKNNVAVKWIQSQQQIADIFTKSLTVQPFNVHKNKLVCLVTNANNNTKQ